MQLQLQVILEAINLRNCAYRSFKIETFSGLKYLLFASFRALNQRTSQSSKSSKLVTKSKLSKSKATGLDKISCRLLRECSDLIAESLSLIFNRSIIMGIFPNEWKCAKVVPIHKQGKRNCVDNYRPISIIPAVAKVFERLIMIRYFNI